MTDFHFHTLPDPGPLALYALGYLVLSGALVALLVAAWRR